MQVNLSGHHVEITPSLRSYVEKKMARILRHCDRVIDVHCTLTVEKLRHEAESTIPKSQRRDVRDLLAAPHDNLYKSAFGEVTRRAVANSEAIAGFLAGPAPFPTAASGRRNAWNRIL